MSRSDSHSEDRSSAHEGEHEMTIQICRGCLSMDALSPANSSMAQAFTQVTGVQWDNERLPRALCVQCKALVTKCQKFREKVQRVNNVLMSLRISCNLNLANINKINPNQHRIKPLLEPTHYPPNHCDLYHDDTGDAWRDEKNFKYQNNERTQEIRFILTKETIPIENENANTQTELRNSFEDPLKSPKREFFDTIDYNGEEVEGASVVDDEEDSEVADLVDSTDMAVDSYSCSSPYLCRHYTKSEGSFKRKKPTPPNPIVSKIRDNFVKLAKSPKRKDFDSRSVDVDVETSVVEDKKNIKIADLKNRTNMMVGNTDFGNSDSSSKPCHRESKESSNSQSSLDVKKGFEEILKSPKKEFPDYIDQGNSHNDVDLETSVIDNKEHVKVDETMVDDTPDLIDGKTRICHNKFKSKGSFSRAKINYHLSTLQRDEIIALLKQNVSLRAISRRMMISRNTVKLWARRYEETGDIEPLKRGKKPVAYTDASERHRDIVERHKNDAFLSTRSTALLHDVSFQTVRRHLKASGLRNYRELKLAVNQQNVNQEITE